MAKYRVTSPEGQNYEVEAPEGASESDILEYAQQNMGKRRTPKEMAYTSQFLPIKRTETGGYAPAVPGIVQSAIDAIKAPGRALQSGQGDYMEGNSPNEADAANVALNAIPLMARRGAVTPKPEAAAPSEMERILSEGRKEGYVTPPTKTLTGKVATLVAGKQPVKAEATIRNQEVTNRIARRESGLAEGEEITDETLAAARKRIAQPYEELKQVSPAAGRLWDQLRQVRSDAKAQWRFYNRSLDPSVQKKARALDAKADEIEGKIDGIAKLNFKPEMLDRLRQARQDLAKNYSVERATSPGGNVDAKVLARDVKAGKPVTGGLRTIGEFEYARRPSFGLELDLEPNMHVGAGVGAHHFGIGAWFNHLPFVGSAARSVALSKIAQQPGSGLGVRLKDVGRNWGPYAYPRPYAGDEE